MRNSLEKGFLAYLCNSEKPLGVLQQTWLECLWGWSGGLGTPCARYPLRTCLPCFRKLGLWCGFFHAKETYMRLPAIVNRHKSVVESFFSLSVLNGVVLLFPLLTLPYILRVVGPANYGVYGFIYILVQYALIFNNYGFDFSATKQVAQHRDDKVYVNKVYNAVIACRFLLFLASLCFFMLLSLWLLPSASQRWMLLGGLSLVLGNTFTAVWFFQGMEKMRYLTIVNVLGKTLFLLLVFVVIRKPEHYVLLPLLDGLGYVAGGITSLLIARNRFGIRLAWPSWADIRSQFRSGAAIFGSTLGMTLYRKSNIFILNFFVGDAALGIYTAAEKIITGFQGIISPVSQALFPHLGRSFVGRTYRENIQTLIRVAKYLVPLLAAATLFVVLFADWLIRLLCGAEFMAAKELLMVMSPVLLFGGMNYLLGIVGLVNLDRGRSFFGSVLLAGATSIAWVLLMASRLGALAGAWAMTLSEFVLFLTCLIVLVGLWRNPERKPLF